MRGRAWLVVLLALGLLALTPLLVGGYVAEVQAPAGWDPGW